MCRPLDSRIAEREDEIFSILQRLAESVSKEDYQQMRSYRNPCPIIGAIVDAVCLILNRGQLPFNDLHRKMTWLFVPAKLEMMQNFVARVDYQPSLLVTWLQVRVLCCCQRQVRGGDGVV